MSGLGSTRFEFLIYAISGQIEIKLLDDKTGITSDVVAIRPRFDNHDIAIFTDYILRVSRQLDERFSLGSCIVVSILKEEIPEPIIETRFAVGKFSNELIGTLAFHMDHTDQID